MVSAPRSSAAQRRAAKVLLIEQYGFLGGMATAGLVEPFMPYETGGQADQRRAFYRGDARC